MSMSEAIGKVLKQRDISPSDLARMTGYTPQYVIDLLKGNRRWNETTLTAACDALGLKIEISEKTA